MTKLEWCKTNAPEALRNESDEVILDMMSSAYESFVGRDTNNAAPKAVKRAINNQLDYMVETLCSELGSQIAMKGGYMLTKLIPEFARQTSDVDFSIPDAGMYESVKVTLREIAEHFVISGFIDHYTIKDDAMRRGVDMYNSNNQKILGIDVGVHDITYGTRVYVFETDINAFTVERMLCDKLTAIMSRKRFRRVKDLYDVYVISDHMSFDAKVIADFMKRRETAAEWNNLPFNEAVVVEYAKAYDKLMLTSIYSESSLEKPEFKQALKRFYMISYKVLHPDYNTYWDCSNRYFTQGAVK